MEGKLLGNRYELLERIGGGGMAIVFKAKCHLLNRFVAVKILRPEFTSDAEFISRFKVESQAAASLSHPNIVPIYDVGNQDDIYYIVMEYVNGVTLKEYINEKGILPWKTAVNIAIQICSALEHAHKNNIVHRDIKPHNIIITKELIAKVTDFGIARAVSSSTITMAGNTIGSVHYFSPEQARGIYTDEKSDLYSLGIVLYEMLTGKVPFDGDTPVSIALKHLEDDVIPPKAIYDNIPQSVNNIVMKAAKKNQSNRYQSASEMLDDLYSALKEPNGSFVVVGDSDDKETTQRVNVPDEIREFKFKNHNNDSNSNSIKREDNNMPGKKKNDRLTVIAALATSFIIITLISVFAGYYVYSKIVNKGIDIKAPNLVTMRVDDAREMLAQNGVTLKITDTRYDDKALEGTIISQNPQAGIKVKSPGEIQVVVSNGQEPVEVPDLTSMSSREAQYALESKSLKMKTTNEYNSEIPKNYVIRQNPSAKTSAPKNSEVEVFISDGPAPAKIKTPSLIGISESKAKQTIAQNSLVVGKVSYGQNKSMGYGVVISQFPAQDTELDSLAKVDITVNRYKAPSTASGEVVKELSINLSEKGENDSFIVKVELDGVSGKRVVYQKRHTREDREISVPISGKGTVVVRVYIDDQKDSEEVIDFGGEAY